MKVEFKILLTNHYGPPCRTYILFENIQEISYNVFIYYIYIYICVCINNHARVNNKKKHNVKIAIFIFTEKMSEVQHVMFYSV